jgi:hypothetical protein
MLRHSLAIGAIILLIGVSPSAMGQEPGDQVTWSYTAPMVEGGSWDIGITASKRSYQPGDGLTLGIEFTINSIGLAFNTERILGVYTLVTGSRVFDAEGNMIGNSQEMASTILNAEGLPIEGEYTGLPTNRFGGTFHHPIDSYVLTPSSALNVDTGTGVMSGNAVHGILLPPDIPAGWYQLRVDVGLEIVEGNLVTLWGEDPTLPTTSRDEQSCVATSPIAIGTEASPRMMWTLFSQMLPNGGIVALEDQGYAAVTRDTGFSTDAILPMRDSRGSQARYLLEPDFPLVWNPFMRDAGTELDIDYHTGWMEVRVENPDGTIVDLGGAPFAGRRGMGATTLQDRFEYSFSSYGKHRIEMTGWIKNSAGQVYTGGGVYEVNIARPIDIEPNVLPGTPFRNNDFFDPGFQVFPPMPVDMEMVWELDPWSAGRIQTERFNARANRWGYYSPPFVTGRSRLARETLVQFNNPGEYKVTFRATYREQDGTLWMGEKVVSGVVFPDDAIELASRPPSSGSFSITSDARYHPVPADSGDTLLIPVPGNPDLPTVFTFPVGFFLDGQTGFRTDDSALLEVISGAAGTFVVPRFASATGLFPRMYPADIDRRAYLISTASRGDHREQSHVTEGSPAAHLPYATYPWLSGEIPSDAPGDLYHFWSGMVYRDITGNSTRYGYYSSGAAISSEITVPRVHLAGTPLISDGWGSKSLVLHNCAVRPGSIVSLGTPFTAGAYYLPLPTSSTIEFTVTPPDGNAETAVITCDDRGYGCDMRQRLILDRPGVWRVVAKLIQEDQVGGVLGVNVGDPWEFYVIDPGNDLSIRYHLPTATPLEQEMLVLTGDLMEWDIVEGTVYISATFNGAVVEQTTKQIGAGGFVYSVDLAQVGNSYQNFNPMDPADRLDISAFVIGRTSTGALRHAARMVYLQGGMIYAGERDYTSINPLTREQRIRELAEMAESQESHEIRGRVPSEGTENQE